MTPKERIFAAIVHRECDKPPTDIWAVPEIWRDLYRYFNIVSTPAKESDSAIDAFVKSYAPQAEVYEKLRIDGIPGIYPIYKGDRRESENGVAFNEWGLGYKTITTETCEYQEQVIVPWMEATTPEDIESYTVPNADDYDYSTLPAMADFWESQGRAYQCGYAAPFYFHNLLRGLEESLVDPILNPDLTETVIRRIEKFFLEFHRNCFEALRGRKYVTQVTDDFGSQHGLIIGIDSFRKLYAPSIRKSVDLAKEYGLAVFHHDDGDCRPLLNDLVEIGIDILNPIQWNCGGWDLEWLKRNYGSDICFHSAVDNQETLPLGSQNDVKAEVHRLLDVLFSDRTGFIIGPCHNIQANTSVENIVALYDAVAEHEGEPLPFNDGHGRN